MRDAPRIYVACLAAYNAGKLHGVWIDADDGEDAIWDKIHAMLKESPEPNAEEWAIHDHEGFVGIEIGESARISDVAELAEFISENEDNIELLVELAKNLNHKATLMTLETAKEYLRDNYEGEFNSLADWAYEFAKQSGAELGAYANFIDWERVGNDAQKGGDVFELEVGRRTHVFRNS